MTSAKMRPLRRHVKGHSVMNSTFIAGQFIAALQESLQNIVEPAFYRDERGFQGELLQKLNACLGHGVLPEDSVIQQECQKRSRDHGIKIRPDIIVHIPFERGVVKGHDQGNFIAIELKRKATSKQASQAFVSLTKMKKVLKYPLTVFINVDSANTHVAMCPKSIAEQTLCFAVWLHDGKPIVKMEQYGVEGSRKR